MREIEGEKKEKRKPLRKRIYFFLVASFFLSLFLQFLPYFLLLTYDKEQKK